MLCSGLFCYVCFCILKLLFFFGGSGCGVYYGVFVVFGRLYGLGM